MRADGLVSFPVPISGLIRNLPPQNVPSQGILDGVNMFVDIDGYLKPRFGYSTLAGLTNMIGGSVTISAGSTTGTANIPVVQATNTYPVVLGVRPSAGAPDALARVTARTTTSLSVEISADPGLGNSVDVEWYIPQSTELAGIATFGTGVSSVAVTFGTPQTSTAYMVNLGVMTGSGTPAIVAATWDTPTLTGFNINLSSAPGVGETILVSWDAFFADPAPNTTHGNITFTGATVQQTVTLSSPQNDTAYVVLTGVQRGSGGTDFSATVVVPTINGFDIRLSGAPGAETVEVDWHLARSEIATLGEPVLGGISFYDSTGTLQTVVATPTKWYQLSIAPPTWIDITDPANPNSGSVDDQVRFVTFPYLGTIWILGVNNTNPMRAWNPNLSTYQTVSQAPICRDIEVIDSRVMAINTLESGTRYSYRVRWSNVNDYTTWQALSNQDLVDQGQPLVAVRRTKVSGAAIYGIKGITIATAQPGTDATAFSFAEVEPPTTPGPCSPAALVSAVGLHYYLGLDARVYTFDGQSTLPVSVSVDALLQQVVSLGFASRFHAVYYPSLRQIWFFFVRSPDDEPKWAAVYQVDAQRFETLQNFADYITTSFPADEQIGYTWLTWVPINSTWPEIPFPSWAAIPNSTVPTMILGTVLGGVERFGFDASDNSVPIAYSFSSALQRLDPNMRQFPNALDVFYQAQPVSETVLTVLSCLAHPTAQRVQLASITFDVSNPAPQGYYPGANKPPSGFMAKLPFKDNVPPAEDVYLQFMLSGTTTQRLVFFGGSECFSYTERRA
jgi:hypothetical protein